MIETFIFVRTAARNEIFATHHGMTAAVFAYLLEDIIRHGRIALFREKET